MGSNSKFPLMPRLEAVHRSIFRVPIAFDSTTLIVTHTSISKVLTLLLRYGSPLFLYVPRCTLAFITPVSF
jgi:hypothetical protein